MSKELKIGILGSANIAKKYIAQAIIDSNVFKLSGIASRDMHKAKDFANTFNTEPYESYDDIISSNIDVVYIPLPNSLHYEWIKKSLLKGLNVIVEKSLTCTLDENIELNKIAQSKSLLLLENFQFRFHNQLSFIKKKIDEGFIGDLRLVRSSFGFPPFKDINNIRYKKSLGGGSLLDAGAYPIKIAQIILGKEIYVDSASLEIDKKLNVDIWGSGILKNKKNNITTQIGFGFDNFYQNNLELWGSDGRIVANRIFTAGPEISPSIFLQNPSISDEVVIERDNHFIKMMQYAAELINNKDKLESEYDQNINQARLIKEFYEKAKQ